MSGPHGQKQDQAAHEGIPVGLTEFSVDR
jgi:hypothetical protein